MLYNLIEKLDKKLNFQTVSAHEMHKESLFEEPGFMPSDTNNKALFFIRHFSALKKMPYFFRGN